MKGIVFTEFFELVESNFGLQVADDIIVQSDLTTGGIYTAVGTYDYSELVQLVVQLSQQTGVSVGDLIKAFGRYLFGRFTELYPQFFEAEQSAFEFLATIENNIHVEVRKLYPEAELPTFANSYPETDKMFLDYKSKRPFADLAQGLISACVDYFDEPIEVVREDQGEKNGCEARFVLTVRKEAACQA